MKLLRTAVLVVSATFALPTPAQETLRPYVAEYELLRAGAPAGYATVALEAGDAGTWRLRSHTRGTQGLAALAGFDLKEVSIFRPTTKGFACVRYEYRLSGLRKRERQVECDSEAIVSRDHRGEYRFPVQAGTLDRQIVSLALARDLAAGHRNVLTYPVVDRERLEPQRYRSLGEEPVQVPAGTLRALKVERLREDSDRSTVTWFGLDNGLVPVRILQQDEGEGFELRLVSLKR
ncbi:DUF3108 domain-containing protein [Xanthomonadaceae bacterium XH05]|nr:DUF3108 domain-containing protein [Xanthomonadaceae bacterium XH05]